MRALKSVCLHLLVFLIAAAVYGVQGPEYVRHPWDRLADDGDSMLNAWILAWHGHVAADGGPGFWDAPIFYPMARAGALTDPLIGDLWVSLPAYALSHSPVFAFHALVFSSFLLGTYCTFRLVRSLTGSYAGGLAAGLLFAFNPYFWSEVPHANLLPFFWAPLTLGLAHRFLRELRLRHLLGMTLTMLAQYYTSINLGTILLIVVLTFAAVHVIAERRGQERWVFVTRPRLVLMLLGCAALGAAALLPLAVPYAANARRWSIARTQADNITFSAEPLSFLVPNGGFAHYGWLRDLVGGHVWWRCGVGVLPWLLAGAGWLWARRFRAETGTDAAAARRFGWTAVAMAVLMLGPFLIVWGYRTRVPLPYFLVFHLVPGAHGFRVPHRFIHPLLLCLAVLAGYAVALLPRVWQAWRPAGRVGVCAALGLLAWWDYAVTDIPGVACERPDRFPPVYRYLAAGDPTAPVLELPTGLGDQFRYLYYQTGHWRPMLGGNSGSNSPALLDLARRLSGPPTEGALQALALTPARTVVIHPEWLPASARSAWEQADLTAYGFRRVGPVGGCPVWERERSEPAVASRLRIVHAAFAVRPGTLRDDLSVQLTAAPAGRHLPWRCLDRGLGDVRVSAMGADGRRQDCTQHFLIPPYLLGGETARLEFTGGFHGQFRDVRRVHVEGPLLEPFEADCGTEGTAQALGRP